MTIIEEILFERQKQDEKWGVQNHNPWYWLAILMEEVGEVAHAICGKRNNFLNYREELIQVAAVAVAMVESFDRYRNTLKSDSTL